MRRRPSLHILLLGTVLDTRNNFLENNLEVGGQRLYSFTLIFSHRSDLHSIKHRNIKTRSKGHDPNHNHIDVITAMFDLRELQDCISCADRLRGQCQTKRSACLRGHHHHSPTV